MTTSRGFTLTPNVPVPAPAHDPNAPMTIAEGRAKMKRRKLTTTEFKAARAQAITVTGYDSSSPIWGKQLPEVLDMIDDAITAAGHGTQSIQVARDLIAQLKARAVTRKLIGQARS
jgi:hypothetical protein